MGDNGKQRRWKEQSEKELGLAWRLERELLLATTLVFNSLASI